MRLRQIFIGSAGESRDIVEKIAHELSKKGFSPRRWWIDFPAGSYTLDRLREIANEVDGAILVGTGVDVVQSRNVESAAPRDNVILEYGLFVGALGRDRCLLVVDGQAKLPSDVQAITSIHLGKDIQTVAEQVSNHFVDYFTSPRLSDGKQTHVVADQRIVDVMIQEVQVSQQREATSLPIEWHQRQSFYGPEGAKNWLRLSESAAYLGDGYPNWVRKAASSLTQKAEPITFVSLGPGDARTDIAVMKMLRSLDNSIRYIPVDICEPLLHRAAAKVSKFASVPIGILGDFEEGLDFILRQVYMHGKRPIVYSLLGGTLGNFDDEDESGFLYQLKAAMSPNDSLLLGISLATSSWSEANDPKTDLEKLDNDFLTFILTGVSRIFGESLEKCIATYREFLKINVREVAYENFGVHRIIEYTWNKAGKQWLCTRICRYSLAAIRDKFLRIGFETHDDESNNPPAEPVALRM